MAEGWPAAALALRLLALDPGLGGIHLRARSGPARDAFCANFPNATRIHPATGDTELFGGLDLAATLAAGKSVRASGLFDRPGPLLLSMAERCGPALAGRLALALDDGTGRTLIALDEGAGIEETLPAALQDRLAFQITLEEVRYDEPTAIPVSKPSGPAVITDAGLSQIARIAGTLGVDSPRAGLLTVRAARAHAALHDRATVTPEDIEAACALCLAHRATQLPEEAPDPAPPPPPPQQSEARDLQTVPDDLILDAIAAHLPADILSRIAMSRARQARGQGSGAAVRNLRRGRPLPSRPGRKTDAARIDVIATLRAAAPWQRIRTAGPGKVAIRAGDIHLRRFEETATRLLIFAVDASGSAALARLAEAKGAVEILLSEAYARRDHVALVSFRGTQAELLLPPTRSLVQTKRRLGGLPGGGGTPLATGLQTALEQALHARRHGMTPTICLLTDGRANIARDGTADRKQAAHDAEAVGRTITAQGIDTLVIDTGNRPSINLRTLAQMMDAPYLPLPRADARRLSAAVGAALD